MILRKRIRPFLFLAILSALSIGPVWSIDTVQPSHPQAPPQETCITTLTRLLSDQPAKLLELNRMAKGDLKAWDQWLKVALTNGIGPTEAHAVSAIAGQLDQNTGALLVQKLATQYPGLQKKGQARFGPKRVADMIMNAIFRPDDIFKTSVNLGHGDPSVALSVYFREVRRALQPVSQTPLIGLDGIKAIVQEFQRALKDVQNPNREPPSALIFGSVINGRGKAGQSDIDFIYGEKTPRLDSYSLKAFINRRIKATLPEGVTSVEGLRFNLSDASAMSVVNPVMIKITPEHAEIWVYPRQKPDAPAAVNPPVVYQWY